MNDIKGMTVKNFSMHLTMMVLCAMVSFVGNEIVGSIFGILIYATIVILQYADGADRGERACTLTATVEKLAKEGKDVDESLRKQTFCRKNAVKAFLYSSIPFAALALANLIFADPSSVTDNLLGVITRIVFLPLAWMNRLLTSMIGWNLEGVWESGSRMFSAFGTYHTGLDFTLVSDAVQGIGTFAQAYDIHYLTILRVGFLVFSFVPPLSMMIGYFQGPKYREKKLQDIAKGSRRKRRKLKVFNHRNTQSRKRGPEV